MCGSGTNLSDHEPLSAVFNAFFNSSPFLSSHSFENHHVHITWHKATSDQLSAYCKLVAATLPPLPTEALLYSKPDFTDHFSKLEDYCNSLCNTSSCQTRSSHSWLE